MRIKGKNYSKAARFVTVTAVINASRPVRGAGLSFPLGWRLYLGQKQVKKLNRTRQAADKLVYVKLTDLVIEMLDEVEANWLVNANAGANAGAKFGAGRQVYVLFDSWYARDTPLRGCAELMNNIRSRGTPWPLEGPLSKGCSWHFICAVKSNRTLSGSSVSTYWRKLSRQPIKRVTTTSTKGSHTYHTRVTTGRLRGVPQDVVAVFSKRHTRKPQTAYFVSSDVRLRAGGLLHFYANRKWPAAGPWPCETDNFLLKAPRPVRGAERLGLADFRLHAVEAIQRWFSLVFASYAFIRIRIAEAMLAQEQQQPRLSFHDVKVAQPLERAARLRGAIVEQQQKWPFEGPWHLEQLVGFVADHARQGWSNEELVAHLLPTATQSLVT